MNKKDIKPIRNIVITCLLCFLLIFLFFFQPFTGTWKKINSLQTDVDTREEEKIGGTLDFQCYTNGDLVYNAWLSVVNAFEKASGVKVNLMAGTEVNTKRQTDWQNGNPPDIVSNTGTGFSGMMQIESDSLADLSEFFETSYIWGSETLIKERLSSGGTSDSYKELFEYFGDAVYLAPYMTSTYGMFYNQKLYADKGLTYPTNYTELKSFSATAYAATNSPVVSFPGTSAGYLVWGMVVPAVAAEAKAQGNLQYFNDLCAGKEYAYDINDSRSGILKTVLERYYEYTHLNGGKYIADCLSKNHTTTQSELYTNKILSLANGQWLYSELYATLKDDPTGFNLSYAASPLISEGQKQTVVCLPVTMAIAKQAKNRPQAEAFLRFLYRDDIQRILTAAYGYQSIFNDFDYDKGADSYSESAKQIYSVLANCDQMYVRYSWGSLGEMFNAQVVALCPGASQEGTVTSAMAQLKGQAATFTTYIEKLGRTV